MTTIYALTDSANSIKGIVVSLESSDLKYKIARALQDITGRKDVEFSLEEDDITGDITIHHPDFFSHKLIAINKFY